MNAELKNLRLHKLGSSLLEMNERFASKKKDALMLIIAAALTGWTKAWGWALLIMVYPAFFSALWHIGYWLMNRNGLSWKHASMVGSYADKFPDYATRLKTLEMEHTLFKIGNKGVVSSPIRRKI